MNLNALLFDENEKPLDRLSNDGGFVGIFRTVACIGDSLASGEFEVMSTLDGSKMYLDRYDYSWGQYMAREAGLTVYNFSRGGMTAKHYITSFANENGFWKPELAANAYVIALGVNDLLNRGWEIGTVKDICLEDYRKNAETFAGQFAYIIQRYKEIQPDARFFLVTMPKAQHGNDERNSKADAHAALLHEIAKLFDNTYVIDLREYGPEYDADFRRKFYLNGHLNPAGYLLTAKMITSYIDYIIRHNLEDFKHVGLMGHEYQRN